jgi:PucR-like helix-turn-helix protein
MQELLGRIAALDPTATLGLRVIACFDELIIGNVNTRALLSAAASLGGCNAGFQQDRPARVMRVTPEGELCPGGEPTGQVLHPDDGLTVWLEREGPKRANDDIIIERLALAVRIRCGQGHHEVDNRRDLAVLLDGSIPVDERQLAAARLGLRPTATYRVVAAPLFAVWKDRPNAPEDVVPSASGPLHALVVPSACTTVDANTAGVGIATQVEHLHHSFRTAVVALRLSVPPTTPVVTADEYGSLIGLLADASSEAHIPDVDLIEEVMAHSWACSTLDALIRAGSVRQAARLCGVHHSTLQTRVDAISDIVGFDPLSGLGRTRLGIAYLVWRLRHSHVFDLPAPTAAAAQLRERMGGTGEAQTYHEAG